MKSFINNLYNHAVDLNYKNVLSLFSKDSSCKLLDLGCDDGNMTKDIARVIGTSDINGVEIIDERAHLAEVQGVRVKNFNLNGHFDYDNNIFDVIHANQVIEHLYNSDIFLSEIYRILKPGGYAVISTENASSWCNIFASLLGWQIFSLTNFSSKKQGIGNPFALHGKESGGHADLSSWNHIRIYNIRGLKEYFEVFGFKVEEIKGAGYFPFPAILGNLDKTHCHFMTFKIRKLPV